MIRDRLGFGVCAAIALTACFTGLRWGLPSPERKDLVLPPDRQTPAVYATLADARRKLPPRFIQQAPFTHRQPDAFRLQLIQSVGSYLVRALDGDEQLVFVALSNLRPREGKWDPGLYAYGGPYYGALGAVLITAKICGAVTLSPDIETFYAAPEKMAALFTAGRLVSAASGLICAGLIFVWARRRFSVLASTAASAVFILSPIALYLSHTVKPHLLATAFAVGAVVLTQVALEKNAWRPFLWASLFYGLAVGTTINLWPLPLYLFIARALQRGGAQPVWKDRKLWTALVFSVVVFFLVNPFVLMNLTGWLREIGYQTASRPTSFSVEAGIAIARTVFRGWGWAGTFLAVMGVGLALARGDQQDRGIILFLLVYFVILTWQLGHSALDSAHPARYFGPFFAFLGLIAGSALDRLRGPLKIAVAVGVFLGLGSHAGAALDNYRRDNPQESIAIQAGQWINRNLPADTRIGVMSNLMLDRQPPFQFEKYRVEVYPPEIRRLPNDAPPHFILSANPTFHADARVPMVFHENFFDLYEIERAFEPRLRFGYREFFSSANYPVWLFKKKP